MFAKLRFILPALTCLSLLASAAPARAGTCPGPRSGYLCFYDYDSSTWGSVQSNNTTWNFGPGNNWDARSDYLQNNGRSYAVCVYRNHGYNKDGGWYRVPLGVSVTTVRNFGRSNKWTNGGC